MNGAARPFERCSKQSRQLATRAISANSQADFHQHVSATLLAAAQEWSLALSKLRMSRHCEALSKIGGRGRPKARAGAGGNFKEWRSTAITSIAFSNLPLAADSLIRSH